MAAVLTKFCRCCWKIAILSTEEILSAKKLAPPGKKQRAKLKTKIKIKTNAV